MSPITPIGKNDARMLAEFLHAVSVQLQIAVQEQCFSVKKLRFHAFKSSKIGCAVPKRTSASKRYPYKRPAFFICKLCDFRRPILPFEKNQMRWVSFHKSAPLLCCPMICAPDGIRSCCIFCNNQFVHRGSFPFGNNHDFHIMFLHLLQLVNRFYYDIYCDVYYDIPLF